MQDIKGDISNMDGKIFLAAIMGADIVVDKRTHTFHSFNPEAAATFRRIRDEQPQDGEVVPFLYALKAAGLVLWGITEDGDVAILRGEKDGPLPGETIQ